MERERRQVEMRGISDDSVASSSVFFDVGPGLTVKNQVLWPMSFEVWIPMAIESARVCPKAVTGQNISLEMGGKHVETILIGFSTLKS